MTPFITKEIERRAMSKRMKGHIIRKNHPVPCFRCKIKFKNFTSQQKYCKKCQKEVAHEYETRRRKTKHYKNNQKKWGKKWNKNNPQKIRCHSILRSALYYKEIVRLPCQECGSKKMIHAHHEDYNKPLDVIWLCPQHHKDIHRGILLAKDLTTPSSSDVGSKE